MEIISGLETIPAYLQKVVDSNYMKATAEARKFGDEQAEHAEAIGNILMMLEKTATQDELEQMAESVADEIQAGAQSIRSRS